MINFFKASSRVFFIGLILVIIAMFVTTNVYAHGNGNGRDNGNGHGYGDCPDTPDPDGPDFDGPDTPTVASNSGADNEPLMIRGCDTDWKRATYERCKGIGYKTLVQGHPALLSVGFTYAVPAYTDGYGNYWIETELFDLLFK